MKFFLQRLQCNYLNRRILESFHYIRLPDSIRPIPAICYQGAELHSPFPIGGIGTGYVELRGDGKLGQFSIYNNYVPVGQTAAAPLLTLIDADGKETPLDGEHADISILAHFPVCNMRYAVKNTKAVVWLRLWTTMIPGDADTSNTPGVVLEVSADDFSGKMRIEFAIAQNVEPVVETARACRRS